MHFTQDCIHLYVGISTRVRAYTQKWVPNLLKICSSQFWKKKSEIRRPDCHSLPLKVTLWPFFPLHTVSLIFAMTVVLITHDWHSGKVFLHHDLQHHVMVFTVTVKDVFVTLNEELEVIFTAVLWYKPQLD